MSKGCAEARRVGEESWQQVLPSDTMAAWERRRQAPGRCVSRISANASNLPRLRPLLASELRSGHGPAGKADGLFPRHTSSLLSCSKTGKSNISRLANPTTSLYDCQYDMASYSRQNEYTIGAESESHVNGVCNHVKTEYGRVIFSGGSYHIVERCVECLANVRGPGVWVSRALLTVDPETLPVFSDRRSAEEKGEQKLLFG